MIPGVTHHARQRMAERHGRDLTPAEWLALVCDILDGRAVLLRAMPPNGSGEIWAVRMGDMALRVVWQPLDGSVVSVLADEHSGNRHLDERKGRVRKSLYVFGTWKRGKRRPARTVWQ